MSDSFIDSNVFIYLVDETGDSRRQAAETLILDAIETRDSCISFQVVQETLNVLISRAPGPITSEDAGLFFRRFLEPLWSVMPSASLYLRALSIQSRYRYRFYDSLIIAAALESGCRLLYSEDLQAGQRIEGLTIENPFAM
ncbi:MAG TPA: PIN domain-containing protein [Dehalococcoidia bacterium]|nr:PIN domain-containing protein [Dehalococcoidia bacterium]